ncbi:MAG: Nre family DNA repair protein [Methanobacteriaceae archaeon]|nr:Nre family DNA repair protein [Methanobacteriaceae archaeon]
MIGGKTAYLKKLTSKIHIKSIDVGTELDGSTPPSVFIGSWNYPKVYAGPMIAPQQGNTSIMDMPESWIPSNISQEEIIGYRLNLVRGKQRVEIKDLDNLLVEKLQEISLAKTSIESEAQFLKKPKGSSFSDEHTPHGPSALIEKFHIESVRWDHWLEKVFYDTDLKAADAVIDLHSKGLPFSSIQKAFSVGSMGVEKNRRLVPTRWSITACDSTVADKLLKEVRYCDIIETYQVYEFSSLNNYYAVILIPSEWQYEWMEAFLHVLGNEEVIFSDYETNSGKKEYSKVGGCYYTCKMAVLEKLARDKKQATAIILREAYNGYIPLGVFNVRENVRSALNQNPVEFDDLNNALDYVSNKLKLPIKRFIKKSNLLQELIRSRQTTLDAFFNYSI